jgi:hypothetical protein
MVSTINYINKRGITKPWKIYPKINRKFSHAMIIPCFSEFNELPNLLESIETNDTFLLQDILIIIIINNSNKADDYIHNDNKKTYQYLKKSKFLFTLGIIDAFSKGFELPNKFAGVGLARKIGMDLALPYLSNKKSLIFSTDADTVIDKNYFDVIINYFNKNNVKAAVVGFQHLTKKYPSIKKIIHDYEKFLLLTAKKIKKAGSPYGYVSMGSTMVCTKDAYVAIGGMPNKKATEDFYFLQELTKHCGVHTISNILVYPSARPVSRVYLGTGYRMKQSQKGYKIQDLYYSDDSFLLLKKWIEIGTSSWQCNLNHVIDKTNNINSSLTTFIINEHIKDIWKNLQLSSPSKVHFIHQFHRWFDGLKTIRFLKFFSLDHMI